MEAYRDQPSCTRVQVVFVNGAGRVCLNRALPKVSMSLTPADLTGILIQTGSKSHIRLAGQA